MGSPIRFSRLDLAPWIVIALTAAGAAWYAGDRPVPSAARAHNAGPQSIVGRASVIDGDTIDIHGTRIRLFGIDAPEGAQTCDLRGKPYRCGQQAAFALSDKLGNKTVECRPKDRDRYHRVVAVCTVAGEDINGWMVAQGWALAYRHYSHDYVGQEQRAANARLGVWQGTFEAPWDWRRSERRVSN
jgi:endonuclease YncB( thermonuclease family)